jgi:hypothetical protein
LRRLGAPDRASTYGSIPNHNRQEVLSDIFLNVGPASLQVEIALHAGRAKVNATDAASESRLCSMIDERGAHALFSVFGINLTFKGSERLPDLPTGSFSRESLYGY